MNNYMQANQHIITEKNEQITEKDTRAQTNRETIKQNNEQLHTNYIEIGQLTARLGQATRENQTLQHEAEAR